MYRIMAAKSDDFAITIDGGLLIISTVLAEVSLHQPGFGVVRIYLQDSVEEDLGNIPSFLGNCSCGVRTVNSNLGVLFHFFDSGFTAEDFEGFHLFRNENVPFSKICQEIFINIFILIGTYDRTVFRHVRSSSNLNMR